MQRRQFLQYSAAAAAAPLLGQPAAPRRPNILLIYADDVGYGDLSCYGAKLVKTPHLDRLAAEGVRFSDAHSSAATCTPSRYSLLTGEYSFRMPDAKVLPGDAPALIRPAAPPLPPLSAAPATGPPSSANGTLAWRRQRGLEPGDRPWPAGYRL